MQLLAILMTFIGCILLLTSLKPTYYLCNEPSQSSWKPLFHLIVAFLFGYSGFLYYLLFYYDHFFIYSILAMILLLGGLFVFLVTRLSLDSYKQIKNEAKKTEYNSLHDSLTGLPNRKYFSNVIKKHSNEFLPFTLFALDLNNFKQVNDALGHYYGDQLLILVTESITKKLDGLCMLFRTGGDEFAIILDKKTQVCPLDVINRIHSAFEETYQLMDYSIESSVSIGATLFPEDSIKVDTLLQYADLAMYASKRTKNRCVYYSNELNRDATQQLEISGRLKNAIASEEFIINFQPILASDTTLLHGAEVLIRWPQKDGKFIQPEIFIPIAEKSGLITQITEWVIKEAVIQLGYLDSRGFKGCLHINLSVKDLQSEALFEQLTVLSQHNKVLAQRLIFEITESAMMTDLARVKQMIIKLSDLGFIFSIDDFGTGFSSLSLLKELPIQQIKIDRTFVYKMDSIDTHYAIVKSAIYLAKNLGCTVVAEGVETESVENSLVNLNCDYLQGNHYCNAIPMNQFIETYCTDNSEEKLS